MLLKNNFDYMCVNLCKPVLILHANNLGVEQPKPQQTL